MGRKTWKMVLAVSALVIAFATLNGKAYAQLLPELVCYSSPVRNLLANSMGLHIFRDE